MRVLITRPEPDAARTAARVRALGFDPVVLPVSKVVFLSGALDEAAGRQWSALAITSANAIRAIASRPEIAGVWHRLPLFAVGRTTALAAADAGFGKVRTADGSGNGLARLIAADSAAGRLATAGAAPLLYCAGRPRAGGLEEGLRAAGVAYAVRECYRMDPIDHQAEFLTETVMAQRIDVALFYSREQTACFFRLLSDKGLAEAFQAARILCLSEAVAAALPETLRRNAAIAGCPSENALLEMLVVMRP